MEEEELCAAYEAEFNRSDKAVPIPCCLKVETKRRYCRSKIRMLALKNFFLQKMIVQPFCVEGRSVMRDHESRCRW